MDLKGLESVNDLNIELFVINVSGENSYKKEEFDKEKNILESKYNRPTPYEIINKDKPINNKFNDTKDLNNSIIEKKTIQIKQIMILKEKNISNYNSLENNRISNNLKEKNNSLENNTIFNNQKENNTISNNSLENNTKSNNPKENNIIFNNQKENNTIYNNSLENNTIFKNHTKNETFINFNVEKNNYKINFFQIILIIVLLTTLYVNIIYLYFYRNPYKKLKINENKNIQISESVLKNNKIDIIGEEQSNLTM